MIINIASALSLERDLFLTQQIIDLEIPTILVVNQLDEAESRGINIDFKILEIESKDSSHLESKTKLYEQRRQIISEITAKTISKGQKKFNISKNKLLHN